MTTEGPGERNVWSTETRAGWAGLAVELKGKGETLSISQQIVAGLRSGKQISGHESMVM